MAKYLVTGGCGFIGSHLCDALLKQGHRVRVIDNLSTGSLNNVSEDVEVITADICDQEVLKQAFEGIEGCFHLAAAILVNSSFEQRFADHNTNVIGSMNVLQTALQQGKVPVCYASSCAIYGEIEHLPLSETDKVYPVSAYACDKYAVEREAYYLSKIYQLPVFSCRFFNVYGTRQDSCSPYAGVVTKFVEHAKAGKPLMIYGDGEQTRDFIYVTDVVSALMNGMARADCTAKLMNVCTGVATSINLLAKIIKTQLGSQSEIIHQVPRTCDIKYSVGNSQYAEELGFKAQYNLKAGLKDFIART